MGLFSRSALFLSLGAAVAVTGSVKADDASMVIRDHKIGYVTTQMHWSVYQTADLKKDCPQGLNDHGPRENFKALYPNGGTVEGTQLTREALRVFPEDHKPQFPYILRKGPIAIGMNLDGKVGPNDFVSPEGVKGIKNNLFKVLGCNANYRAPEGQMALFSNKLIAGFTFDRIMLELSNVDNIDNQDNVDVTIYRGRDPLLLDGTGEKVAPGGTQRVDMHYGKALIQHLHGRIKDGVLTTDPVKEGIWPWANYFDRPAVLAFHDMRFQLKLTANGADGLIAGYVDTRSYYNWVTSWSTHHLAYGQLDPDEFWWAVRNNSDAYPDEKGQMTAISSAITLNMAQVFIVHPDEKVASADQ